MTRTLPAPSNICVVWRLRLLGGWVTSIRRQVLQESRPTVLFPGNIQGRNVRETGPKGCHLIEVEHNQVQANVFHPLDVVQLGMAFKIDAGEFHSRRTTTGCMQNSGSKTVCKNHKAAAALAVRVEITGTTPVHADLVGRREHWLNQFLKRLFGHVWARRVARIHCDSNTALPPDDPFETLPEDALGGNSAKSSMNWQLTRTRRLGNLLEKELKHLDRRLPSSR